MPIKQSFQSFAGSFIGVILALGLAFGSISASAAETAIKIGWTAWSDAEFVTKLAQRILEDKMGMKVELLQTDIAPQYQGIKSGDIDIMLMSWQPGTHEDYMAKIGTDGVNLGLLYTHARLGWAVPNYMPEKFKSIADLNDKKAKKKLKGTITGIDPGAGLTRLSKKTIEEYGLNYELQISSGAGMTAALDRAIKRNEWIVVTSWSPHWMFGKYDIRYLDDPKGVLGSYERVHAVARKGFYQDNVEAAAFFSRMQLPIDQLEKAMFDAQETSYEQAVTNYIANNGKRIQYWITGDIQ